MFPALGAISYRTVLLQNDGDLPVTFCLDHRSNCPLAESVCLQPSCGLIQPGDHQILTLRTIPTEDSPKQGLNLSLQLNSPKFKRVPHYTKTLDIQTHLHCSCFFTFTLEICLFLLGIDCCECGGKAVCVFGKWQQSVFPSNSSGFTNPAHPSHQELKPPSYTVACFYFLSLSSFILVLFSDIFSHYLLFWLISASFILFVVSCDCSPW